MKTINLLGSTGSIGVQSLDVARARGYKVEALAAFSDVEKIEQQIREFKPEYAALVDEKAANDLLDEVEAAMLERQTVAESFEPYRSLSERRYPYYRIYVKNFVVEDK